MVLLPASASVATAVIPTVVPAAAFSATVLVPELASVTEPMSNSSTSPIAIVKVCVATEPSEEAACTVIVLLKPVVSALIAAAVVTTPVVASIWNSPPALSVSE